MKKVKMKLDNNMVYRGIVLIFDRKYSFWYFYGVLNNAFDIFS